MSLYYLSSLGLQLFIYFLFTRYQLAIRAAYYADYIYCIQVPGFKTGQYSSNLFLIAAQILSSLQLIFLGVASKPCLFSIRQISFKSQSYCLTILRKLSVLSFLIAYLLLFRCTLISRQGYSLRPVPIFLGVYFLSLWYRLLSINIKLIVLLAVPYYYIITSRGVASLRPQISIALSRYSAYYLAVIQIPPYYRQQRFISLNRINSIPLVSSRIITNIIFSIYGTPLTLKL